MVKEVSKAKYGTVIQKCKHLCIHAYQDNTYGQGMRVHNLAKKGDTQRCTVCGK